MLSLIVLLSEIVINAGNPNTLLLPTEQTTFFIGGTDLFFLTRNESDCRSIYRWIPAENTRSLLWQTRLSLNKISSAAKKYVACIEYYEEKPGLLRSTLIVLSADTQNAETVIAIDNVWEYSWDPSEKKIAYTTGSVWEISWRGYKSDGVFVCDIENKTTEKIAETGYDLYWADFDGKLYFMTFEPDKVWRYDCSKKDTEETAFKATTFSPEGRYYYVVEEELSGFHLYRSESKPPIEYSPKNSVSPLVSIRLCPSAWIGKTRLRTWTYGMQGKMSESGAHLLDVETGEIRFSQWPVLAGIDPDKVIVLKPDGNFAIEQIEKLPIVKAEDLPKNPELETTPTPEHDINRNGS